MRWVHGIVNSTDMSLSKLWERVMKDSRLVCCSPLGSRESDMIERLNNNKLNKL